MKGRYALRPRVVRFGIVTVGLLLLSGCQIWGFTEQREFIANVSQLTGSVRTDHQHKGAFIVFLVSLDSEEPALVDHYVLEEPGRWMFRVLPGSYAVGAFEDRNADGVYDDEPTLRATGGRRFELAAGQRVDDIELVIPWKGRADVKGRVVVEELQLRSVVDQERRTSGQLAVAGEIVEITDPRFSPENAELGLWRPVDFVFDVGAGIYFLEKCDPRKTPVLFVHGIRGNPREFEALIAGLDRQRLQPWLFYYPSGNRLDSISSFATQMLIRLRRRCPYDELFVVAHSMGGLVARSAVLEHAAESRLSRISLFVSISSPWRGIQAAASLQKAPEGIQQRMPFAFEYVALDSPFINGLFYQDPETRKVRRRLPENLPYHLLFGHTDDETVPNRSAARWEAVDEAVKVWPLDYGHTSILTGAEASRILNDAIAAALAR
jgi:pimeloyl-ACP methyl ester carboxylesterase